MEEDIKILEEMLKDKEQIIQYHCWIGTKSIQAIENLIKGHRELEAKVKRYEKYLDNKDKRFKEALENEYQERETDYIPKSKIKEEIEELGKWLDDGKYANYGMNPFILKAQKEILEKFMEE